MSTVKISELPIIPVLNADTTETLFPAVDVTTGITGRITAKVVAASLYSNDVLNVGNNSIILPNVVAQFASQSNNYVQINLQNSEANGSADYVVTADSGDDSNYYIDMGYNGSTYNYDGYTYAKPLDGYLIVQGSDNTSPGGNLVIGTTTAGKDVSILVGSIDDSRIMAKFVANTGFKMLQYPIYFADGTSQNTAASSTAHTNLIYVAANAAYSSSNTVGSYANSAYTKANIVGSYANSAYTAANSAADSAVSGITAAAVADAKAVSAGRYANSAFTTANNALANTTGTLAGDLTVTGNTYIHKSLAINNASMTGNNQYLIITGTVGNAIGTPSNPGYTIHTATDIGNRIVGESYSNTATNYASFIGRRARGTGNNPLGLQTDDIIVRFGGNGYGSTKFSQFSDARIEFVATENHTDTAKGTKIRFLNTAEGSNTAGEIATFNANAVTFTGSVNPQKGFVWSPRIPAGNQTAITIDYSTDSIIKANCAADLTISHTNFVTGKVVEVWLVNTSGLTRTITHGISAINSTTNSTTFSIPSTSSAYLRFFSIDSDLANTFVTIQHA